MFKFQTLNVWKKAINYVDELMSIADVLPQKYQFSVGEQLRRAALSITNNIAEGVWQEDEKRFYFFL